MLTRTVQISVRVDGASADKLERIARKHDISAPAVVRQMIQDYDEETEQLRRPT